MSSANEEDDDDNRLKPYKGERGGTFRTFRRDFLAQARGKFSKDDRFSFKEIFLKKGRYV